MYNKFNLTPPTSFYTTQDISRLYDQLMSDKQTFPTELSWLSEKVLANKDSRCIQEMWDVYLSVMSKIKVDIFGLDIPWKKDPAQAERTLHMLLNEHYYKKLYRLSDCEREVGIAYRILTSSWKDFDRRKEYYLEPCCQCMMECDLSEYI